MKLKETVKLMVLFLLVAFCVGLVSADPTPQPNLYHDNGTLYGNVKLSEGATVQVDGVKYVVVAVDGEWWTAKAGDEALKWVGVGVLDVTHYSPDFLAGSGLAVDPPQPLPPMCGSRPC